MNITEFYRMDQNNPGDWYSNPSRYFFADVETNKVDIDNVRKTTWNQMDTIIVGGGGLLGNSNFEDLMKRIAKHPDEQFLIDILEVKLRNISVENKQSFQIWKQEVQRITLNLLSCIDNTVGPRILWGAGHNSKDVEEDLYHNSYPEYINQFHLVGVRDWNTDYRWVPCPSCMHEAFDKEYEITNKVVWLEHKKRLIDNRFFDVAAAPRMLNTGQNMQQIIEFLGSAETVVTNSYHGVYWATLLGRKVVCVPWGSKFNMFKHPPTMATERNWSDKIEKAKSYPNALEECRNANKDFFRDVTNFLSDFEKRQPGIEIPTFK